MSRYGQLQQHKPPRAPWPNVAHSFSYGQLHPDTIEHTRDLECLPGRWQPQWRLKTLRLYGGTYCNGLQTVYETDNGQTFAAAEHAGSHHDPKWLDCELRKVCV